MDHLCIDEKKIGSNGNVVFSENVENIMDGICVKRKVLGQVKEEQFWYLSLRDNWYLSLRDNFGHIVREKNKKRLVLEGKIDGSRSRGRQIKK